MKPMARKYDFPALLAGLLAIGLAAPQAHAGVVIDTGGMFGRQLIAGPVDIEGDGVPDIDFVILGTDGFLDALNPFGLTGSIGGFPGKGDAWVRGTSEMVALDGIGRNEIIDDWRGALFGSADNWSKVHFSSGNGWVQWEFGQTSTVVTPLVFVREDFQEDLSARQAFDLAYGDPVNPDPEPIPEPASLLLMLFGIAALRLRRLGKRHVIG
jgi:hypothetical protein